MAAEARRRAEAWWGQYANTTGDVVGAMVSFAADAVAQAVREEREASARVADAWAQSKSCQHHDDNPCCHVRTGAGIAEAIRDR